MSAAFNKDSTATVDGVSFVTEEKYDALACELDEAGDRIWELEREARECEHCEDKLIGAELVDMNVQLSIENDCMAGLLEKIRSCCKDMGAMKTIDNVLYNRTLRQAKEA